MKLVISPGDSPGSDVLRAVSLTGKALAGEGHLAGEFSRPDAVLVFGTGQASSYPAPVIQFVLDGTEDFMDNSSVTVFQSSALREAFNDHYSERTAVIPCPADPCPGVPWEPRPGAGVICLTHSPGDGRETFLRAVAATGRRGEFLPDGGVFTGAAACVFPSLLNRPPPGALMDMAASGVPVLAASSRFIHDLLQDGVSCLLHSPGNHLQLAGQLCHLLDNPGLARYLSGNAVEFCRTTLSMKAAGEMWSSLLEQVCFR